MAANGVNGHSASVSRPLKAGIYAPIPTFFLPGSEDLDLQTLEKHIIRTAQAGVAPLLAGSMGEAAHLSHEERTTMIKSVRKALDGAGFTEMPIIFGTGAASLRETIQLSKEAAAAGADYSIIIASGYFAGAMSKDALKQFFTEAAANSPIPVIIYNFPGASGGIDLDSDLITELAYECPNTIGVKLTCGNVGKLTRIADAVLPSKLSAQRDSKLPFLVLGGFIDFLVPSTYANAHGAITGLANLAPITIAKTYELADGSRQNSALLEEAQRLQGIIARADYTIAKYSIAGTKYLVEKIYGYGGVPRKPLLPLTAEAQQQLWSHPHVQELVKTEREFSGKA